MARSPGDGTAKAVLRGPFSRPLRVSGVPATGLARHIEATPDECAAIAKDLKLPAVTALRADLRVTPGAGGRFDVAGTVETTLTQVCVVTLEPFESTLRPDVEISFAPPLEARQGGSLGSGPRVADVAVESEADAPDPMIDNTIDLGAVALEFAVLACDPYPKKPGVHFSDVLIGDKEREDPSPFSSLERYKDRS